MLEQILTAVPPYPSHLHRHVLQLYLIKHRRPPATERERRRAVYEYLTRTQNDDEATLRIHASPGLVAWLAGPDEAVRAWRPLPRLAGLVHQFSPELRRRYDLETERDWREFACFVALTLQSALRWPEELVPEELRRVLWEPAPGFEAASRIGLTRALQFVRRNAPRTRGLDPARAADYSQLVLLVLADVDEGKLPAYVLSPAQYAHLCEPVRIRDARVRLTGLLHHLIVERGLVQEHELARPDVADAVRREIPSLLARLRLPAPVRAAHGLPRATLTPLPEPAPAAGAPVTVVGPLSHGSGLGAATRATVEALRSAGVAVEVLNHVAGWGRTDEAGEHTACTRVRGDITVIHFNPDVFVENVSRFGIEQFEGRYNIGFFFWETSRPSLAHRLGADLVDEIWVSTEYCRAIFAQATDKPVVVVRTPVPRMGELAWASRRAFGLAEHPFTFVYTFDGASRFTRKNPLAAVRAFQQAFPRGDDVQLVIKTHNTAWLTPSDARVYVDLRAHARADRRIVVIDESFSSNEVHGLISVSDCYVSLHRSEGFGLGMAEAMRLGVPVIATAYSGNADFTTEATAYPVRYRLVPVAKRDFVYEEDGQEWAEPDVEHAAARMREVRTDPQRKTKVRRALELVQANYNEDVVGRTYRERIEAIRAELRAGAGAVAQTGA